MRIGYIVHHHTCLYDGVRADKYRNDPYAWTRPYLWSFCHLNQNPRVQNGMTVLFVSRVGLEYPCDMVFRVAARLPFREAHRRYEPLDTRRRAARFAAGIRSHPEVWRPGAPSYVATRDIETSYVPHPAVRVDHLVDVQRLLQNPNARPLCVVFRRPSVPLRITDVDAIVAYVGQHAQRLPVAPWVEPQCDGHATWRGTGWSPRW
jgi:hypothetical protein